MSNSEQTDQPLILNATDYHVLMVLLEEDLYGYAIMRAVEQDSKGAVSPGIGSLYRILARLVTEGLVEDVDAPKGAPREHRGRQRRYYSLTHEGRAALKSESLRLQGVLKLAQQRSLLPEVPG